LREVNEGSPEAPPVSWHGTGFPCVEAAERRLVEIRGNDFEPVTIAEKVPLSQQRAGRGKHGYLATHFDHEEKRLS
jgi:hypothetical protein